MSGSEQEAAAGRGDAGAPDTVGEAFENLGEEIGRLVHAEVDRLRTELGEHARDAGRGAAYLAGAASLAAVSAVALGTLPILALRHVLPGGVIAVGIGAGSAAGAVVLTRRALDELRRAAPESVEQQLDETVASVVETVRERVGAAASAARS